MNKKSILILGASGLVGRDLIFFFSKKYNVFALSRNKNFLTKINEKNIKIINHDMVNPLNFTKKIDCVINCIVTHPFSKKNNLKDYIDSNIITSKNIVSFIKKRKVKLFFNLSSMAVYGRPSESKINEKSNHSQIDLLAICKLFLEKAFETELSNCVNLRLPGILCNSFDSNRPWLNTIIYKIRKNIDVKIYNGEKNFNNLIDTYEIFNFINYLIEKKIKIQGTYNLAASKPVKLISLIKVIKLYFDSDSKILNFKTKNNSFVISSQKIKKDSNYNIRSTLHILEKYLSLQK